MNPTVLEPEVTPSIPRSRRGEPTWEVALLFPVQGQWTEEDYLALDTNRLIELSDGCLEVLPMPTFLHQFIARYLFRLLDDFVQSQACGEVLFAPLPVHLFPGAYREPDLVFLLPGRLQGQSRYPQGADLVVEIVSEGAEARQRDVVDKRQDYAQAGIAEYWIVDPEQQHITVLTLDGQTYREHGIFSKGGHASSVLPAGFAVDVAAVFAAGEQSPR